MGKDNGVGQLLRHPELVWLFLLLAVVCLLYLPFLGNPFVFDDLHVFTGEVSSLYARAVSITEPRWVYYASLGWTAEWFGEKLPHHFHLGNLLLHWFSSISLFFLIRYLLAAAIPKSSDSSAFANAVGIAALLFALHPAAVYAVGYVTQRSVVMATLFVLLMQLTYLHGLLTGHVRWLAVAVVCYFLAVFSKEHSVLAPALLAAITILFWPKRRASLRALLLTFVALVAVAVFITLRVRGVLGVAYEPMSSVLFEQQGVVADGPTLHLLSAMTQAGLYFKYLFLWILPNVSWMSVDMREPFVASLADWHGWAWLSVFIVYGGMSFIVLLRGGMLGVSGFALLYPWLLFGVEMAGIRVQEPFVLYRSYLWMPGLLLLVSLLILKFPSRKTMLILGAVALLLASFAWNRLWVFADNYRLWNDAALLLKDDKTAGADRIYYNRGQALMAMQKWEDAAGDFERSAAVSPQLGPIRYFLGLAYSNSGHYAKALVQFDAAIAINADDDRAYLAKGMALKKLRHDEEARLQFAQSCKLHNFLGCLYASAPRKEDNQ